MHDEPIDDTWTLPSRQGDFPGRPVLGEALLHRRRERTFLILATLFVAATAATVILGTSRVIDLNYAISAIAPDRVLGFSFELPFGVLTFPIALFAATLVCELYGRRRAYALVGMGLITSLGLAGLMYAVDRLDGTAAAFGPALALTGCLLVAHVANVMIFDRLRLLMVGRHPLLRKTISTLFAQIGGWSAFAFISYGYAVYGLGQDAAAADGIASLAIGSAIYVAAFALVDLIPFAIAARTLTDYLRVGDGSNAVVVEPTYVQSAPVLRGPASLYSTGERSLYTTGERRFFTEGEELSEPR